MSWAGAAAGRGLLSWEVALGIVTQGQVTQTPMPLQSTRIPEFPQAQEIPSAVFHRNCSVCSLRSCRAWICYSPRSRPSEAQQGWKNPTGEGGISMLCLPQACLNHWQWIFKWILGSRDPVFLSLPWRVWNAPFVCGFREWPQQQMLI